MVREVRSHTGGYNHPASVPIPRLGESRSRATAPNANDPPRGADRSQVTALQLWSADLLGGRLRGLGVRDHGLADAGGRRLHLALGLVGLGDGPLGRRGLLD